jgi:predicted acyl esterase
MLRMKKPISTFLCIALMLAGSNLLYSQHRHPAGFDRYIPPLLPNYRDAAALDSVIRVDFEVTMSDGAVMDCLKFMPVAIPPPGGWPTVIMVHGYGDNKETLAGFCKAQAEYGYYTMTYSVRGQGLSGGLSNLISTVEMQDLLEIINYVRGDVGSGANPDNILIMGGSQGGLLPYMAACNGAQVKTIISALAPPNFASSWIENGCIKMTLLWTVEYTSDTARYTSVVDRMSDWIYANNKNKWDSLAYWLPIGRDFMNQVQNIKVPMLIEGSWQDKFFNADGIMEGISHFNAPFSSYIGAVQGHGGDHSATEDQWHMQYFNDWFFHWLFGIDNGIMNIRYQYASTIMPYNVNKWTFVHDSSIVPFDQTTSNLRLYFNGRKKLLPIPGPTKNNGISLANKVSRRLTMKEAVDEEFKGSVFNSKFKKAEVTFVSKPLTYQYKWLGTPKINMQYKSSGNTFCQYNFQVFEVAPDGKSYFITRINYTDRNYVKGSKRIANFKGQAHSHIFQVGSRIKIVLTNLDTTPTDSSFLASNPFVLPVLINSTNYLFLNNYSYIDIPVIGPPAVEPMFADDNEEIPVEYSLKQNYPNPFNPVTTIAYTLAAPGKVELRVYDILGREVKTLVNEVQQQGTHAISFNASELSSGVYFYKIESGSFKAVKKMVLVK